MNFASENEYNALIDALKNITDVVSVLTNKINSQEEEILKVKKNNENLENNRYCSFPITGKALGPSFT